VSAAEVAHWEYAIDDAMAQGSFLYAATFFLSSGIKPA